VRIKKRFNIVSGNLSPSNNIPIIALDDWKNYHCDSLTKDLTDATMVAMLDDKTHRQSIIRPKVRPKIENSDSPGNWVLFSVVSYCYFVS
jgi:hypothetical protein